MPSNNEASSPDSNASSTWKPPSSTSVPVSSISPSSARASRKLNPYKPRKANPNPTASPPSLLTFGVEIECLILYKPEWYAKHASQLPEYPPIRRPTRPKRPDRVLSNAEEGQLKALDMLYEVLIVRYHVNSALRDVDASVRQGDGLWPDGSNRWVNKMDGSVLPYDEESLKEEGWAWLDLELTTPILKYAAKALEQVETVLKTLNAKFNDGVNWQFYTNSTCGLHVHVGKQTRAEDRLINAGHPFFVARNLLTFGAFFEKQINAVFPPGRLNDKWMYAPPLSQLMRSKRSTYGIAEAIERSTGYRAFSKENKIFKHTAYNIQPLLTMDDPNADEVEHEEAFKTFEFRQHHGTVESDEVLNWVRFVCGLIRLCHRVGEVGFPMNLLRRHNQGLSFLELLDVLNMSALKEHYSKPGKLFKHPEKHPWETAPSEMASL